MSKFDKSIVWFRNDLRVSDNPALSEAVKSSKSVLFVYTDWDLKPWPKGGAYKIGLSSALKNLEEQIIKRGGELVVLKLSSTDEFIEFIKKEKVDAVFWNRRYDRYSIKVDKQIKSKLIQDSVEVNSFNGSLLMEPFLPKTQKGDPYQVYTPFSKYYFQNLNLSELSSTPQKLNSYRKPKKSESVANYVQTLLPKVSWDEEMKKEWDLSESEAMKRLRSFLKESAESYSDSRNMMADESGTSKLSPYLAYGVISPKQIFWEIQKQEDKIISKDKSIQTYQKEVIWREFAYHLIYHFPKTDKENLRDKFDAFPWEKSKKHLELWKKGKTGYPVVDAAMKELWVSGWMHNRARMIVASFLVKDLRIHWLEGAKYFADTLIDFDLASNTLGWQWTAGCGADAAPYFRIFNPILQGERFDPDGDYVKRWIPQLKDLPKKWIHKPWEAPEEVLNKAGVKLGVDYPKPMVDHSEERDKALEAFKNLK